MTRFARECGEFSQCWKRWLHLHLQWLSILSVVIFQLVCQANLFSKHSRNICKPSCYRWRLGLRTFHVCVCSARLEREMLWRWDRSSLNVLKLARKESPFDQTNMKDWSNKYECNCRPWKIIKIHFTITGGFFGSRQYQARAGDKRSVVVVRLPREDKLLTFLF